jgi:glycosyltransferase involved in cell wall biosynthesis
MRDRAGLGIGEDRFVMISVGRIVARKGIDVLLDVVRRLDDPRDLLLVIGAGPLRESLEAQARELGVAERVRFAGRTTDVEKWQSLACADAYVSTAMHEGFGLVFLEAMHSGLPIVCYDCGGQTDFLEDGRTGAVVPLGDSEPIVDALRRIKADPALRTRQGAFNRARVLDFSIERCAARYEEIFAEVVR